ncbi:hypothetical protein [Xanthocytophaga flava]|uniref:hypothetical protein n=1 Tax=Xanthocytophaga flava TaxID=3048013 RepID=UPI0028D4B00B|nr:hypothetical protein [Xanthocytophaga flavus]MDJ1470217.1 hypothetical protein [Xanthocytophaga flavus]
MHSPINLIQTFSRPNLQSDKPVHFSIKSYTQCISIIRQELINIVNANQTLQKWAMVNGLTYSRVICVMDGTIQNHYNADLIRQLLVKIGYEVIAQHRLLKNTEALYLLKKQSTH